jgi:hypothetical protein
MANHPQNSPRGLWSKVKILIGTGGQALTGDSTALILAGGLKVSGEDVTLTANSTSMVISGSLRLSGNSTGIVSHDSTGRLTANGGIKINNAYVITADNTALTGPNSALPGNYSTANIAFGQNSTGNSFVAVRTTGTTWKYLNVTTALPT